MLKSTSFIFDGIPSEQYGVMIYFLNDDENRELDLGTDVEVIEERLPKRITPIHYGVDINKSMSFPLTFGSVNYLSDDDVDAILSWLTGHSQYKWLEYVDGEHYIRYKCHLNNMQSVYINGLPVAFTCDVECDGQFAYEYNTVYEYNITDSEQEIEFVNKSSYNGYLYPKLEFQFNDDCNGLSIFNDTDQGREFNIRDFNRETTNSSRKEQLEETTFSTLIANGADDENTIAWNPMTISSELNFNDVIIGQTHWVALPKDGAMAMYSKDKGQTWTKTSLPYSGTWTGCIGESGFVAICTTPGTAVAARSSDGETWSAATIELPSVLNWTSVSYVETSGLVKGYYVAVAEDSNILAYSSSGASWQSTHLPSVQDWRCVFGGNGHIIAVGGNTNVAAWSSDCITWRSLTLPHTGYWTSGCYDDSKESKGFIIVCDNIQGSKNDMALHSTTGAFDSTWNAIEMPTGSWSKVVHGAAGFVAIGDKSCANSIDLQSWRTNTVSNSLTSIAAYDNIFVAASGSGSIIASNAGGSKQGSYTFALTVDSKASLQDLKIYGEVKNPSGINTYHTTGKMLLASYSDKETVAGESKTLATVSGSSGNVSAATMSAYYQAESENGDEDNMVTITFVVNSDNADLLSAVLYITAEYTLDTQEDLNYNGLVVKFDNQNQIITTNKDTLNMYEYFNRKFFRLVKGSNTLRMSTTGGSCKLIMNCEFLRKVGGR